MIWICFGVLEPVAERTFLCWLLEVLFFAKQVQDKGPGINYKQSLLSSAVVFKEREEDVGIGTDKRDIQFLYSLVEKQ